MLLQCDFGQQSKLNPDIDKESSQNIESHVEYLTIMSKFAHSSSPPREPLVSALPY
jgi:hypothetical protein